MATQYYGGQAVIEGVMMRGAKAMAVAVRNPQGGIEIHEEPLKAKIYTAKWGQWPFVRGLSMLWDALGLGFRALMWSAEVATKEPDGEKVEFAGPVAWTTIGVSLLFAVALFFFVPTLVARGLATFVNDDPMIDAIFEGVIRVIIFIGYLWVIGRMAEIKRVFGYHGAEHKTINAYEAGAPLTPESVQKFSVQHTRCGTSFLLYVIVISIILFAPLTFNQMENGALALVLRFASRLLLVPVVASIAYEMIRFSASHQDHWLMRIFIKPGLWLQKLTTREPDDSMVECAIAALRPVLQADGRLIDEPVVPAAPSLNGAGKPVEEPVAIPA